MLVTRAAAAAIIVREVLKSKNSSDKVISRGSVEINFAKKHDGNEVNCVHCVCLVNRNCRTKRQNIFFAQHEIAANVAKYVDSFLTLTKDRIENVLF